MAVRELNLLCMAGQGSVQAGEVLSKVFTEAGSYVSVNVYPGTRARSAPVINYLKVSDSPGLASCANYHPSEAIVFQEELLEAARHNSHEHIADAIGRMKRGTLLVNSSKPPGEIVPPYSFSGVVATVDATEIASRLLRRNPPPVGLTLLGAHAKIAQDMDPEVLLGEIRQAFPGRVGELNAQAAMEAYESVQALGGVDYRADGKPKGFHPVPVDQLPQHYRFDRYDVLPGVRQGSPFVWRDKVPVCDDTKCICPKSCISEALCPDATGFIVRAGLEGVGNRGQGYRIDVDFCRGCGICAEVCVGDALTMVDENQLVRERPDYGDITVEPFLRDAPRVGSIWMSRRETGGVGDGS